MADYLKLFSTQADYNAYIAGDYPKPNVSYIEATDETIFTNYQDGPVQTTYVIDSMPKNDFSATTFFVGTAVTNVNIPSSVTTLGNSAFYKCTSLTSVTVPDGVTYIDGAAFQNCTALTEVTIGSGIETILHNVFSGCTSLESVTILATTPPTVGTNFVPQGTIIYVPAESVEAYKAASGWSAYESKIQAIPA